MGKLPVTEHGVVRIIGNPRYPNTIETPAAVAARASWAYHLVLSLLDREHIDASRILATD
ncbi:hypothetical protein [Paraburkholderia sacchari]|uniref:hypothetical protein n=1 Tax=Paraburkholderia sacchari TaxID=159450 RepID=UPI0039A54EA6